MILYLDSSALIKRYIREKGSDAMNARFDAGVSIAASQLAYAEVFAVLGRKFRTRELGLAEYSLAEARFVEEWGNAFRILEVSPRTLTALPRLVRKYPLRGSDAVHLSAALYLLEMQKELMDVSQLEFGVSDKNLAGAARDCGFTVFDPEV